MRLESNTLTDRVCRNHPKPYSFHNIDQNSCLTNIRQPLIGNHLPEKISGLFRSVQGALHLPETPKPLRHVTMRRIPIKTKGL
jgi:hypothetical protein